MPLDLYVSVVSNPKYNKSCTNYTDDNNNNGKNDKRTQKSTHHQNLSFIVFFGFDLSKTSRPTHILFHTPAAAFISIPILFAVLPFLSQLSSLYSIAASFVFNNFQSTISNSRNEIYAYLVYVCLISQCMYVCVCVCIVFVRARTYVNVNVNKCIHVREHFTRSHIRVCLFLCVICVQIHARSLFKKRSIYATKPTPSEYECVSSSMVLDTKQISIVAFSLYLMCHTLIDTRSFVRSFELLHPFPSVSFVRSLACLFIHSFIHQMPFVY